MREKVTGKTREAHLKWFGHIKRIPLNALMRKYNLMKTTHDIRMKGRPKKAWMENIKKRLSQ